MPTKNNIAEEIIDNAVESGIHDPRFYPIAKEELVDLNCNVDILSELEQVSNIERDLNPRKYGVFITTPDRRSGLLLPDLDGVDTVYQQLSIACSKGDIDPQDDDFTVYRFTVDRFEE
jgi:MEMO1 family protein